jgi:hypothetical protein
MSNARNLARVLADNSGAIAATNLANAVPADGSITNAKIVSVAASKLTGQVADSNAPSGSVIQAVQFTSTPQNSATSSTAFVNSGIIDVPITPQAANSKILIEIRGYTLHLNGEADNWGGGTMIYRSIAGGSWNPVANDLNPLDGHYINAQYGNAWRDDLGGSSYLDSPSYTLGQTITYQLWGKRTSRGASWYMHHIGGIGSQMAISRVVGIAMEIAA